MASTSEAALSRFDADAKDELLKWSERLGVTPKGLEIAVLAVGNQIALVEHYLDRHLRYRRRVAHPARYA